MMAVPALGPVPLCMLRPLLWISVSDFEIGVSYVYRSQVIVVSQESHEQMMKLSRTERR